MMKAVVVSHWPACHVISVLMLTWSQNFNSYDKVPPPREIDWAQDLGLFAQASLSLVVDMAEVRTCSGGSDGGSRFHYRFSCLTTFTRARIRRS